LGLRLGKFGAFIGCSNYPECKHTTQLFGEEAQGEDGDGPRPQFEPKSLGVDPKSGFEVFVKIGPYGPYLELSGSELVEEKKEEKPSKSKKKATDKKAKVKKPKRISIPKNLDINTIDLKTAAQLLTLPREVGMHPETGEKIIANIGPFGPYLLHNKKFTSVKEDNILEIGLNRAVDLIVEAANRPPSKRGRVKKK
jgi:DNA topoisomerase-1